MALKDWKRDKSRQRLIIFSHKMKDEIIEIRDPESSITKTWTIRFKIFILGNVNDERVKMAKTKSQALKFAKAYMRKH